mgnify:FL=1|tara:strand:- start:428 stop:625 length:198 start_codon:yes stop_codon:yes gene_type:complete
MTEPFDDHLGHSIDDAWTCELCTGSFVGDAFNGMGGYLCEDCYEHLTDRWTTKDVELFQQRGHDV